MDRCERRRWRLVRCEVLRQVSVERRSWHRLLTHTAHYPRVVCGSLEAKAGSELNLSHALLKRLQRLLLLWRPLLLPLLPLQPLLYPLQPLLPL